VLIRGESGVGKELFARAIHDQSPRRDGPLVRVNCASVPRELFESEFFGHVRGSFTGALKDRAGRFELADRGTLFLDEVGDIPLDLQAKLLRVLQEGQYERIGEDRTRTVNVRLLAATNRNLEEDIAAGRFRSDLYYRLATFPLLVPPLRERGDDVLELARHYLALCSRSVGRRGLILTPEHERLLLEYPWPGNVRELAHVIERAVILSTTGPLRLDLALPKAASVPRPPPSLSSPGPLSSSGSAPGSSTPSPPRSATSGPRPVPTAEPVPMTELKRMERDNILAALEKARWRVAGPGGAAELLGLRPTTLRDRMRALGLRRES
jgi:transcriptional regulator with GAF, ATPase, and Fis domain